MKVRPAAILHNGFVFLALQLFSGAVIQIQSKLSETEIDQVSGDPKAQIIFVSIYGITLLLILRQWKQFIRVATRDKLLLLLVGIALVSVSWSFAPEVTLRRSVALIGTTLFGMYLATRYTPSELLRLFAWTFSIGALLSVVFVLVLPTYGLMPYQGHIVVRGIYRHKNLLARLMALNAATLLLLVPSSRRHRWVIWTSFGLSVGLLLLSTSKSGLVLFLILLALLPIYRAMQLKDTIAVPFLLIAVVVSGVSAMWLLDNLEFVLNSIGKDITLTGRTYIWAAVIEKIQERPLLGYGYSGFWLGEDSESVDVLKNIDWKGAPNAHNGLLDLWIDLGFLGVSVFLLGFLMSYIRGLRWLRLTKSVEALWVLEFLPFMLIDSQDASNILGQNDIFWALYVAVVLSIPILGHRKAQPESGFSAG